MGCVLKYRLIAALIWVLGIADPAAASGQRDWLREIRPALKSMGHGDYKSAYAGFYRRSRDNPLAQFNLGLIEKAGLGRQASELKACDWFGKASKNKIPASMHFYAECFVHGIGRPVNIPAAIGLFKEAADRGHLLSLETASEFYIKGVGVPLDVSYGLGLLTQAAMQEAPGAMLKLGNYYAEGKYIPQDLRLARRWYQHAAEHRLAEAQYRLAIFLAEGKSGEAELPTALAWMEAAASSGYRQAYLPTAILYASADVDRKTGVLAPEHLAKIYLWLMAAKKVVGKDTDPAVVESLEEMLEKVMPSEWVPELDRKVADHFSKHPV